MTLIKKRDVKDYFAARRLQGSRLHIVPSIKRDATGLSGNGPGPVDTNSPVFAKDFPTNHTKSGTPLKSSGSAVASTDVQIPPARGKVRE